MSPDWGQIFGLSVSPWEMIARGTAMYWALFVLFRVMIRRRVGAVGMADVLILVIIADAAQNAMSGEYKSVPDGLILVSTILLWNVLTDWLTYVSPAVQRVLEPPPLLIIDHGRLIRRHLRMEFMSEQELHSKLREHGITEYAQVEKCYMESDGEVSVIKR